MYRTLLGICAGVALAGTAFAQVGASITGRVEDASGASLGGATVTVKSLETGATRSVTADEAGDYSVVSLPVGPQEVRVEKTGFKAAVRSGINLVVGQDAVVNFQLQVGEFVQQVTVSEQAPLVNTTPASVSGLVGERDVKELPLNGRSFDNLITLNPGAINYNVMKSANTTTSDGNSFSVAGRRPQDNLYLLNGIEYTGSSQLSVLPGGVSGYLLGVDAVREFNLLTDSYSAEYGKRAGGQVIVVTQSGTNALHGSLFEFLRNSALDSPGAFDNGTVPPFRRNQFGASLGGPLKKDRLFLFGTYEGFRQAVAASTPTVVPDTQARLGNLPDPKTGIYSKVPGLNDAMLKYMNLWPAPNGNELLVGGIPTGTNLSNYAPKGNTHEDFGTLRTDYNLAERDRLTGAYTIDDGHSLIPLADPLFGAILQLRDQVSSLEETHVFSPRILNTFRAGYSRAAFNYDSPPLTTLDPSLSFVTGLGPGGITISGGTSTSASGAITAAGANNNAGVWNRRNLFTYTDGVQISHGRHQISTGVWFQRLQDNEDTASRRLGIASFASLQTFLTGTLINLQVVPNHDELGWRSLYGAWYIQDAIKIRPNLTLQLGLRDEFTTGWNEASNRAANYITDASGVLLTAPSVGSSVYTSNNATHLWAPRAGLAWDPFSNGKTAIRAGFGTYYSLIDALSFLLNSLPPYNGSVTFTGSLPSRLPITPNVPVPAACGPGVSQPCSVFAPQGIQPDAKTLAVEEWNFSIEQQLDRNTALRLAYVGSHGYHGLISIDPNTVPSLVCSSAGGCVSGGTATAANRGQVSPGAQYIPVTTCATGFTCRPNPYLSAGFFWYTEGNSSYNALQFDVTRRLAQGLQFRANYTWSKNLDMNSGLTIAQANNQPQMVMDRFDLRRDWGPSALTPVGQASLSAHYELPFGQGKPWLRGSGVENRLLGGWQLNGIVTLLGGFPFTPLIGANRSGDGNTRNPDRPSLNPSFSGPVILGEQTKWYDPGAFMLPTPGTWGNLGRGVYRGPGLEEIDFSVFKNMALTERINLQFRTEFFNLANRINLGAPNATAFSGSVPSPSAGLITTLATLPRQIQFGLKLMF